MLFLPSRSETPSITDIASSSSRPDLTSSLLDTRTLSSFSTLSVDGARMMMFLSPLEWNSIKLSSMMALLTKTTSSWLSGPLPCSMVVLPKFCGTPPPELDAVSLTSSPEETPLVLVTPPRRTKKVRQLTFTTDGTDRSSSSTTKLSLVVLRFSPSSLPLLTLRPKLWNSSDLLKLKSSSLFLDPR